MIKTIFNLTLLLLGLSFISRGQSGKAAIDNKSVIETKEGGILIFNNFNKLDLYFYMDFKGGHVNTTERANLFEVGGTTLQVLALDKNKYKKDSDVRTLENHAKSELDYIGNYLKVNLNSKSEIIKLTDNLSGLLWYYEMPESVSKEVKAQLFISFIYKDFIVGVNTAQFSDQTFEQIKTFLKQITANTTFSNERITLEYLCANRGTR